MLKLLSAVFYRYVFRVMIARGTCDAVNRRQTSWEPMSGSWAPAQASDLVALSFRQHSPSINRSRAKQVWRPLHGRCSRAPFTRVSYLLIFVHIIFTELLRVRTSISPLRLTGSLQLTRYLSDNNSSHHRIEVYCCYDLLRSIYEHTTSHRRAVG